MNAEYPHLFSPFTVNSTTLKNRIVALPTAPVLAKDHLITDELVTFYGERAAGGAAMVVSEMLPVHPTSLPQRWCVTAYGDTNLVGFQRIADSVRSRGSVMIGQIMHVGRQQLWGPTQAPIGVSDLPDDLTWTVPRVMTVAEIRELVEAFVNAAAMLRRAGFSGVEVHGATGHLITQFLSPWSNSREDEYGGDLDGRTRFARAVIAGIRETCGADFIIGLKIPGTELIQGGIDVPEAIRIVRRIHGETPIDYAGFAQGNFSPSFDGHLPDMHTSVNPYLGLQKEIREAIGGIPVIAFGRVGSPADAELTVASGAGDLVGLARALLSDPGLPNKAASGRTELIRPCVFCNVCWGEMHISNKVACIHNPHIGEVGEATWEPKPAAKLKRITVVGGGVAGLEAAWVAAARGHEVTVLGTGEIGGKARIESLLPGRGEIGKVFDYQYRRAIEHGVRFAHGKPADIQAVLATEPDEVVLATGSTMRRPVRLSKDSEPGMSVRDYLAEHLTDAPFADGTAVLFDFDQTMGTYGVAELLSIRFARTVLLSPAASLGRGVPYTSRLGMYRRLNANRVDIRPWQEPIRLDRGVLTYNDVLTGERGSIDDVALFVWSTPRLITDDLLAPLTEHGLPTSTVGDCKAPRAMAAAIHEGHTVGEHL